MLKFNKNIEDPRRGISLSLKERTNSYSYEVCDMYKKVLLKAPSELHLTEKSLIEGEVQYTQLEQLAEINPLFMFSDVNENAPFGSTIPYGGIEKGSDVEFNIGKLPIQLRRILFKFIKIIQKNEN